MIIYKFPHLTPGYSGKISEVLTLNASFYSRLFSASTDLLKTACVFPQRTPNSDFFLEILSLETADAVREFKQCIQKVEKTLETLMTSSLGEQEKINWLNIALRYGLFNNIVALENLSFEELCFFIEYKYIEAIAKAQIAMQKEQDILVDDWTNLYKNVALYPHLEDALKLKIYSACIVLKHRFNCAIPSQLCHIIYKEIVDIINKNTAEKLPETIKLSVAYRGIAMMENLSLLEVNNYLQKAHLFANNALQTAESEINILVAKENLYTCLQSIAKWEISNKNFDAAETLFNEMILLDEYDSTAYTELGLMLFKNDFFEKASFYLEKSTSLGPPGIGMNYYFNALCMNNLGKKKLAEQFFLKSMVADPESVSPLLELINYYVDISEKNHAIKLAKNLIGNDILKSQLLPSEMQFIQSLEGS